MRTTHRFWQLQTLLGVSLFVAACGGKPDRAPATTESRPPSTRSETDPPPATTTAPPMPVESDTGDNLTPLADSDPLGIRDLPLDLINERVPLEDIHFDFDSAALSEEARRILDSHAENLRRYPDMAVLIEGHCDERGTVEYNLALGERRANAAYNYLLSLGIPAARLKTISYGKEFPLDPGHNEAAWAKNRRGHFEITAK